jgi:hypothetical protein
MYCIVGGFLGDVDGCGENGAPTLTTAALNSTIGHIGTALTTTSAATAQYFDPPAPSMMLQWQDLVCDVTKSRKGRWERGAQTVLERHFEVLKR